MNDIDLAVPLMDGPSYDRACSLVPSEYVEAWEWFLGEEQRGGVWTSLPHHTKEDSPSVSVPFENWLGLLSRNAGFRDLLAGPGSGEARSQ